MTQKELSAMITLMLLIACGIIMGLSALFYSEDDSIKSHLYSECVVSTMNPSYCNIIIDELMEYRHDEIMACNDQYDHSDSTAFFDLCLMSEGVDIP